MRVSVDISQDEIDGDYGSVDGLRLTCGRCGHCVEIFGTSDRSARAGVIKLRDECPQDENNYCDVDWYS